MLVNYSLYYSLNDVRHLNYFGLEEKIERVLTHHEDLAPARISMYSLKYLSTFLSRTTSYASSTR